MPIKRLTAHGHLQLVERVLHHVVSVQLVNLVHDGVHIASHWVREEQELGSRQGLEASQTELLSLEMFQARCRDAGVGIGEAHGRIAARRCEGGGGLGERELGGDRASDGVDTVYIVRH